MTALRVTPAGFGYPPAHEARRASEQAFERAMTASCALVVSLFAIAYLLRGLLPAAPVELAPWRDPVSIGGFVLEPSPPIAPAAPRPRPGPGVPMPVPDDSPMLPSEVAPEGSGTGGTTDPAIPFGPAGGEAGTVPPGPATPEPGIWVSVEQLPEVVLRVAPVYPDLAREAQVEGTVQLWALVDLDGSVREVRVRKSVPLLDAAAVAAVSRWRFTPALSNSRPVRVWVAVPVRFTLH